MTFKYFSILLGKLILLAFIFTACFIMATFISGLAQTEPDSGNQPESAAFLILLTNSVLTVILFAWPYLRSDHPKWKSILSLFIILFSIGTFLPQLDSLFFSSALGMSQQEVGTIIYSGAITTLLYIPISVLLLSSQRRPAKDHSTNGHFPYRKILSLSLLYLFVYFIFGYFVAWQSPDLREFYSGSSDILPFWTHMKVTWSDSPALFGLQIFRGLIWALLAYLVIWIMKAPKWEKIATIALLFSLTGTLLLLIPNPYMPEVIRKVHFIEVVSSNLLFGFVAGVYLLKP